MTRPPILMLDTNIASYAIKHRHRIDERLDRYDRHDICLSAVTEAELLYGLRDLPETHSLHQRVPAFLERFRCIPWDSEAAKVHAVVRHLLISTGRPIGEMDTMIASHAIAMGITLVTHNTKHFLRLSPPLRLETWVDPSLDR